MEGKNSITLNNCDLTANNTERNGNAKFPDSIMIYQSMSGDADSYVTEFQGEAANVIRNGHTLYINGAALPEA